MESTFWTRFDTSQVKVFGINDSESFSTAVAFASNFGLTYPVLHDPQGIVYSKYIMSGLSPYPRDVIIDQNGIIAYMNSEYDPQYMLQTINQLLGINEVESEPENLLPFSFDMTVFPNPFNSRSNIRFTVLESQPVTIDIFNLLGEKIVSQTLQNTVKGKKLNIPFDLNNYASGMYFITLKNGKYTVFQKIVLLR